MHCRILLTTAVLLTSSAATADGFRRDGTDPADAPTAKAVSTRDRDEDTRAAVMDLGLLAALDRGTAGAILASGGRDTGLRDALARIDDDGASADASGRLVARARPADEGTVAIGALTTRSGVAPVLSRRVHPSVAPAPDEPHAESSEGDRFEAVVRESRMRIQACYAAALESQPTLAGRIEVSWRIAPSGEVEQPVVTESSMDSPDLEDCVVKTLQGQSFSASEDEAPVRARHVFEFVPAPGA